MRYLFTLTLALIFSCQGIQADQNHHHSSDSSSSSTESASHCQPNSNRSLTISSTLESLQLTRGEFTAEYFIELTNTSDSAIKDVIIQDTVSVSDNVIESLSAEVSYETGTIFPSGQVLTLPTIDRIEANSTFSFTLSLHMTLDPGVTANVVQNLLINFLNKGKDKRVCSIIETSTVERTCDEKIPIFQSDLDPNTGFIIPGPGCYCLAEDLVWDPAIAGIAAINNPNFDNVHIDLNCHSISQRPGNTLFTFGIKVDGALNPGNVRVERKNISVKNGDIRNLHGVAIQMTITNNVLVEDLNVFNIDGLTAGRNIGGIAFNDRNPATTLPTFCTFVTLRNSKLSTIGPNLTGGVVALHFTDCNNCTVENIDIENVTNINNTGGINGNGSSQMVFNNIKIDTVTASVGLIFGFNLSGSIGAAQDIVANGVVFNNLTAAGPVSAFVVGQPAFRMTFTDCEVNRVSSNTAIAGFFTNRGRQIIYRNCNVRNLATAAGAGSASGFTVHSGSMDVVHENCNVSDVTINTPTGTSRASGFGLSDTQAAVYRNCFASHIRANINTGDTVTRAAGFGLSTTGGTVFGGLATGTIYENCISEFVTVAPAGTAIGIGSGFGFDLTNQVNASYIDCFSKNNDRGFFNPLAVTNLATSNTIIHNFVTGNTTSGIEDATTAPSVYYQNTSYNNGPAGTTNYVGALFSPAVGCGGFSTAAAPIRLWDLPNPPCTFNNHQVVGDTLDNLDISN